MSLKSTSDHLFQLVYFPTLTERLLDSINTLHIDPQSHGNTSTCLTCIQQDLLQLYTLRRNEKARECNRMRAHTHRTFKKPMISHQRTHMHAQFFLIFPLTLICLCSNISRLECGEGFSSLSLLLSPSGLDCGWLSAALTLNLPTCRHTAVLQSKQSVSLSAGHLGYFQRWWKILKQTRCQLERRKKKVPSEVKKHSEYLWVAVIV